MKDKDICLKTVKEFHPRQGDSMKMWLCVKPAGIGSENVFVGEIKVFEAGVKTPGRGLRSG